MATDSQFLRGGRVTQPIYPENQRLGRRIDDISPFSQPRPRFRPHNVANRQAVDNIQAPKQSQRKIAPTNELSGNISRSTVLARSAVKKPNTPTSEVVTPKKNMLQIILVIIAITLFLIGAVVAALGFRTDHTLAKQATKLTAQANSSDVVINNKATNTPSTVKPTPQAVASYQVAPNHPRYLIIPKLNVKSRVFSVGVNANGDLGTPNNVYDTAWYNQSALPGQPGAVLIDGHVSGWTTRGVFYGLKGLVPGDQMSIMLGNGNTLNYAVVKSVIYNAKQVNMASAMQPITPNQNGLNLISCTGDIIPGTSQYNERIIVYTKQL